MQTKTAKTKHRCAGHVWEGKWGFRVCRATAKHQHDGEWYCGSHHPPSVLALQAKRDEARAAGEAK